jgi:predicted Rdx family selenoprotein
MLSRPIVFGDLTMTGCLRVLKYGEVAVCWIWEQSEPERSIDPFTKPQGFTAVADRFDLDCPVEVWWSIDERRRAAYGEESMLAILATDRPVVIFYCDAGGQFHILQNGDVDVRSADHAAQECGEIPTWPVERQVIRDLVTGERTWFHPQDPAGSDQDAVICPGGF